MICLALYNLHNLVSSLVETEYHLSIEMFVLAVDAQSELCIFVYCASETIDQLVLQCALHPIG